MRKLLDSDWLRAVQFKGNTSAKSVAPVQFTRRNRGFARYICCMAGTRHSFSYGKNFLSYAKYFHFSFHTRWLSCKTSILDYGRLKENGKFSKPMISGKCSQKISEKNVKYGFKKDTSSTRMFSCLYH